MADATPTLTPTPTPEAPWYQGLDNELVGHIQNKGWDKLDPKAAAIAAVAANREAQKVIGVSADKVLRLPDNMGDATAMKPVWQKLGAPADKSGYEFDGIKFADGSDLDEGFVAYMRDAAASMNLPKDTAKALTAAMVKHMDLVDQQQAQHEQTLLAEQKMALEKNWGTNYAINMTIAKNAALNLGVSPEEVAALEKVVGFAKVMDMFRKIGSKTGEDTLVGGGAGAGTGGVMTQEQAVARKADLMRDSVWKEKYSKGDTAALDEMWNLNQIISGVQAPRPRRR